MCVYKVQKTGAWRQLQLERPEEARVLKGTEHGNFVYNVQLVDFQNGNYSTHKINPFAWKAFGLHGQLIQMTHIVLKDFA